MRPLFASAAVLIAALLSAVTAPNVFAQNKGEFQSRGNLERTGSFPASGLPQLNGVAWQLNPGIRDTGQFALAEGLLIFGNKTDLGFLVAMDANSGKVVWRREPGQMALPPAISGGIVFGGTLVFPDTNSKSPVKAISDEAAEIAKRHNQGVSTGSIFARSLKTGNELWRRDLLADQSRTPLTAVGGRVYLTLGADFVALEAATGKLLWKFQVATKTAACVSYPAIANGVAYVTGAGRYLYALDVESGRELWRVQPTNNDPRDNNTCFGQPMLADGLLISKVGYTVNALDPANGSVRWQTRIPAKSSSNMPTPTISNGVVLVPESGVGIWGLRLATGETIWTFPFDIGLTRAANGILYFTGGDNRPPPVRRGRGVIYAMDIETRRILWSHDIAPINAASPSTPIEPYWAPGTLMPADNALFYDTQGIVAKLR
jgi:outer membrane protein assembly factor BamB